MKTKIFRAIGLIDLGVAVWCLVPEIHLALLPVQALGINEAPFNSSFFGARVLYVNSIAQPNNGIRGRQDYPYKTITAAKAEATNGDTIVVFPGTYTENNLLKVGVNYYFHPGARLYYTNTSFDLISG